MTYLLLKHLLTIFFFKPRVHFKTRLKDRLRGKRLNEVEVEDIGEKAERRDAGADKEKKMG